MIEVPDWLQANVSRETISDLEVYVGLVLKWNPKINLISKSSVVEIWDRHIWDAVQIQDIVAPKGKWADLGSGGGFPGIIIGILMKQQQDESHLTLVESDQRKSAFLRTAIRELELPCHVVSERIESTEPLGVEVLSARALADLDTLLGFAKMHCTNGGTCVFPKGATWEKEVKDAKHNWSFDFEATTSKTNQNAAILTVRNIQRV